MTERRTVINGIEITTDGRTVWVNTGINLGRYGPLGVDVHASEEVQLSEGEHCVDCFKRSSNPDLDWHRFVVGIKKTHDITVPEAFRPKTFYEYAGFNYEIVGDGFGSIKMQPVPGQHAAASKEKHRQNARHQYLQEHINKGQSA